MDIIYWLISEAIVIFWLSVVIGAVLITSNFFSKDK